MLRIDVPVSQLSVKPANISTKRYVEFNRRRVELSWLQYLLVEAFCKAGPGNELDRATLNRELWAGEPDGSPNRLDQLIRATRSKLPGLILTGDEGWTLNPHAKTMIQEPKPT